MQLSQPGDAKFLVILVLYTPENVKNEIIQYKKENRIVIPLSFPVV
jgi:hypothetical protein